MILPTTRVRMAALAATLTLWACAALENAGPTSIEPRGGDAQVFEAIRDSEPGGLVDAAPPDRRSDFDARPERDAALHPGASGDAEPDSDAGADAGAGPALDAAPSQDVEAIPDAAPSQDVEAIPDAAPILDAGPPPARCDDGEHNGAEDGVDCGGDCLPCDGLLDLYEVSRPPIRVDREAGLPLVLVRSNVSYAPDDDVHFAGDIRNDGDETHCFVQVSDVVFEISDDTERTEVRSFVSGRTRVVDGVSTLVSTCIDPGDTAPFFILRVLREGVASGLRITRVSLSLEGRPLDSDVPLSRLTLNGPLRAVAQVGRDDRSLLEGTLRNGGTGPARLGPGSVSAFLRAADDAIVDRTFDTLAAQRLEPRQEVGFTTLLLPVGDLRVDEIDVRLRWDEADD